LDVLTVVRSTGNTNWASQPLPNFLTNNFIIFKQLLNFMFWRRKAPKPLIFNKNSLKIPIGFYFCFIFVVQVTVIKTIKQVWIRIHYTLIIFYFMLKSFWCRTHETCQNRSCLSTFTITFLRTDFYVPRDKLWRKKLKLACSWITMLTYGNP
jgi:hypothetical protein